MASDPGLRAYHDQVIELGGNGTWTAEAVTPAAGRPGRPLGTGRTAAETAGMEDYRHPVAGARPVFAKLLAGPDAAG